MGVPWCYAHEGEGAACKLIAESGDAVKRIELFECPRCANAYQQIKSHEAAGQWVLYGLRRIA